MSGLSELPSDQDCHIRSDMRWPRRQIPSTAALIAFESAARHCNFSRAAVELNTSQSAISRHISGLETQLTAKLFERRNKTVRLTDAGTQFYHAVVSGLETIRTAAATIAEAPGGNRLTLACTHEISHLFVMPRFDALQSAVGPETRVRVMTYEYDTPEPLRDAPVDLFLTYDPSGVAPDDRAVVFREAVTAVCAPHYASTHRGVLEQGVAGWGDLTFLELTKPNAGWATWDDWFARAGAPDPTPTFVSFENYLYLLEAAASGRGLALGWRGLIERYLEAGSLVPAGTGAVADFIEYDRPLYALLAPRAREHAAARACLAFLALSTARD